MINVRDSQVISAEQFAESAKLYSRIQGKVFSEVLGTLKPSLVFDWCCGPMYDGCLTEQYLRHLRNVEAVALIDLDQSVGRFSTKFIQDNVQPHLTLPLLVKAIGGIDLKSATVVEDCFHNRISRAYLGRDIQESGLRSEKRSVVSLMANASGYFSPHELLCALNRMVAVSAPEFLVFNVICDSDNTDPTTQAKNFVRRDFNIGEGRSYATYVWDMGGWNLELDTMSEEELGTMLRDFCQSQGYRIRLELPYYDFKHETLIVLEKLTEV